MKKYVVLTVCMGVQDLNVMTTKELSELWEQNEDGDYLDEISAYDYINGKMTKVDVDEIAKVYLKEQREIQEEYEEYTEYVNEYGYDYQDNLEMGFDPYEGDYTYDC